MFNYFVRGVKRVFGYGDTSLIDNNVTSSLLADQPASPPVSSNLSHASASSSSLPAARRKRPRLSGRKQEAKARHEQELSVASSSKPSKPIQNGRLHIPSFALPGAGRKATGKKVTFKLPTPTPKKMLLRGQPRDKGKGKGKAPQHANGAAVSKDSEIFDDATPSSTPAVRTRATRQPKCQQDIRRNLNKALAVPIPSVMIEGPTTENPLSKNYSGTINGIQYYTPDCTQDHKCGHINEHRLACGHWVKSSAVCGSTCRDADAEVEAFICRTCYHVAKDFITDKSTIDERYVIRLAMKGPVARFTSLLTELIIRRCPSIKGGVTELALCIASHGEYGRTCEVSNGPASHVPIQDLAREVAKNQALRQNAIEDPFTKHDKRESEETIMGNKRMKVLTHNTIEIAGTKRSTLSSDTIPHSPFHPISLPATPNPTKRQHMSRSFVAGLSGSKHKLPPVDCDKDIERHVKRYRATVEVRPKVPYAKFYGNIAVLKMLNRSSRVIRRDTDRRIHLNCWAYVV